MLPLVLRGFSLSRAMILSGKIKPVRHMHAMEGFLSKILFACRSSWEICIKSKKNTVTNIWEIAEFSVKPPV